jgi:hypothetical protein
MRATIGVLSVLIPAGLIATAIVEPIVWPRGSSAFDTFLAILGASALSMMAAFVWHALRSGVVPTDKRRLWVVVLLFVNVFALPLYWFYYLRNPRYQNESR